MAARTACLDLDTFFVSVERLLDPSLVGKPVIVGGPRGGPGVVVSASYEVRPLGVRAGLSMKEATQLAPHAIFVSPRHGAYSDHSAKVRAVLERWCPDVRPASIDEFYLDFGGCDRLYHRAGDVDGDATIERTLRELRARIQEETGLPASIGIGATRAVAKMASGRAKPANVWMVREGQERAFAAPLAVRKFPGFGPVAEKKLHGLGITTLGDLLALPPEDARLGGFVQTVQEALDPRRARVTRDRPAFQEHDEAAEGTLSNERTFFAALGDEGAVHAALRALVERVSWRLRRRGGRAATVSLKLRYADFTTLQRSCTITPTAQEAEVLAAATGLLARAWTRRARIRLLGVCLSHLVGPDPQVPLFPAARPRAALAIDAVRERFGYESIRLGAVARRSPADTPPAR